jgi:hopanoid biosynthesis associated protein HpnK
MREGTHRRLIVNADDAGLTVGHNRAVIQAHRHGVVTSTSLLANGPAFDDAVARLRTQPALGVGVHLTLLEGVPLCPPARVCSLVGGGGWFGRSVVALFRRLALGQVRLEEVRAEWRAQIERVLGAGLCVTHLDSHKHVHMHPRLWAVTLSLAAEYDLGRVRLSRPLALRSVKCALLGLLAVWAQRRAAQRGVRTPHALIGLEASGHMTTARAQRALDRPWRGACEWMAHPAYRSDALADLPYRWVADYRFEEELEALCAAEVRETLARQGIEQVSYAHL